MTTHWNMSAPPPHPGYPHHPHTVTSHSYMSGGGAPTPPIAGTGQAPPQVGMSHMTSGTSKSKHTAQSQNNGQYGVSGIYVSDVISDVIS